MINLLILSRYDRKGASSRYRLMQYIPYLEKNGFKCDLSAFFDEEYLYNRYGSNKWRLSTLGYFIQRFKKLMKVRQYDLIFIEKEIFPFLPAWAEMILKKMGIPYAVDYDDAIFHRYDLHQYKILRRLLGGKVKSVIKYSDLVTAGNQYLSDYAKEVGAKSLELIPTVVDLDSYDEVNVKKSDVFTIVWIGSPTTARYVAGIEDALAEICKEGEAQLIMIGGKIRLNNVSTKYIEWSEETEIEYLKSADVGIMPLPDEPWERGKCGFKLIQYMASKLPVIASPVGVNCQIVEQDVNGYLVEGTKSWITALNKLKNDKNLRLEMGLHGWDKVNSKYCLKYSAPILAKALKETTDLSTRITEKVVKGFGLEWDKFDQLKLPEEELEIVWKDYFKIFPWNKLPEDGGVGADIGCGSGRWARFVSPRVRHLYAIDPSQMALNVAERNLKACKNVSMHLSDVDNIPLDDNYLDFAYSLGVLHHIPDPAAAIRAISKKLKKSAPFLVYMYYSFDNKPKWFRTLWKGTDYSRRVISILPFKNRYLLSQFIAFTIYWPFARMAFLIDKIGTLPASWPLSYYKDKPLYIMRNDSLDRFGTVLEQRFSRDEIKNLLEENGFENVRVSDEQPFWCACGTKK